MKIMNAHKDLVNIVAWIDNHVVGFELSTDERSSLAVGCFDVALEHQAAIALLNESKLHGSMVALIRILTESLVRGLWFLHCASEAEIARFKKGKLKKNHGKLIEDIEEQLGDVNGTLSIMKENTWSSMNDFTHTGYGQVSRRYGNRTVGGNYSEQDITHTLSIAGALGLIAASQLAAIGNRLDLVDACIAKMKKYANGTL